MGGGAASVAIALLLATIAAVMANEIRSLIAGEAVAPAIMEEMKHLLGSNDAIEQIAEVATLHLGPRRILVALTLRFKADSAQGLREAIKSLTVQLKAVDDRIAFVFVRPLDHGD
jgi:hypothetical protein